LPLQTRVWSCPVLSLQHPGLGQRLPPGISICICQIGMMGLPSLEYESAWETQLYKTVVISVTGTPSSLYNSEAQDPLQTPCVSHDPSGGRARWEPLGVYLLAPRFVEEIVPRGTACQVAIHNPMCCVCTQLRMHSLRFLAPGAAGEAADDDHQQSGAS
jgi:hypothetical protein